MSEIYFATAPDGTRLPVIDVTNPAFTVDRSPAQLAEEAAAFARSEGSRGLVARVLFAIALRIFGRRSRLIAGIRASRRGYLTGLATYVLKLGPKNLVPPYALEIDKRVAASLPATSVRVRLLQSATLVAAAVAGELAARPGAPLHIIDIAGGPAIDALNALLILRERDPELLRGHPIVIAVLDIDAEGPAFGQAALKALAPLEGFDITMTHVAMNWTDTAQLAALVAALPAGSIRIATSEGGLFEYGSDAEIVAVLEVLAKAVPSVVGSVTRGDSHTRALYASTGAKVIPRGLELFTPLAAAGGYGIERVLEAPFSDQVLMASASSGNAARRT